MSMFCNGNPVRNSSPDQIGPYRHQRRQRTRLSFQLANAISKNNVSQYFPLLALTSCSHSQDPVFGQKVRLAAVLKMASLVLLVAAC